MQCLDAERHCPSVRVLLLSTSSHQHSYFPKKSKIFGVTIHQPRIRAHPEFRMSGSGAVSTLLTLLKPGHMRRCSYRRAGRPDAPRSTCQVATDGLLCTCACSCSLRAEHIIRGFGAVRRPLSAAAWPCATIRVGMRSRQQLPTRHANRPQAAADKHAQAAAAAPAHAGAAQIGKGLSWLRARHIAAGSQNLAACGPFCVGARGGQQRLVPHVKLPQAAAVAHARQQLQRLPVQVPDVASRR